MSAPWQNAPIGDLFDIGPGKSVTPNARHGNPRYPFLRTSNVLWGRIDLSEVDQMHFTQEELKAKNLKPGDLLVCEGGEIGRSAIWDGQIQTCAFQNHLHRLRPRRADVEPRFFMYALQAGFTLLGSYEGAGNKTTIPNLSRSRLSALEVPMPPHAEQLRIVHALSAVERAARLQEQADKLLREAKIVAASDLLTNGTVGEAKRETDIGVLPASWEVVRLGDALEQAQYGLSIRGNASGRVPILRMNCQVDGAVAFRDLQYIDINDKMLAAFRLQDGDILFNRTNSFELVGRTAVFHSTREAVFASYLIRLEVDRSALNPDFLNYYLNQPSVQAELKKLASRGVSQANISASKLRDFRVPKAPMQEQTETVRRLAAIDAAVQAHSRKHAALEELFNKVLRGLMAGELRADHLDLPVAEVPAA